MLSESPERLGAAEVQRLFERYHERGDPRDQEALFDRFMPLARHLCRRYHASSEFEDLEQVASLALLKAIDRYDPSRGSAFSSFAVPTIVGELKRYFRDFGWAVKVPRPLQELATRVESAIEQLSAESGRTPTPQELAERLNESVERVLEARSIASAHRPDSLDKPADDEDGNSRGSLIGGDDAGFERAESASQLETMLAGLSERQQIILRLRFEEDMVQREIAQRVGVSQMQVSRQINAALESLRAEAEAGATGIDAATSRPSRTAVARSRPRRLRSHEEAVG